MNIISNQQLQLAHDFVQYTNANVFLTGKAGTGKTTFLHYIRKNSYKRSIVVAPTGVAAINAGGVTIHSFFQLPFGPIIPDLADNPMQRKEREIKRVSREKIGIMKSLDLLIIDEISMVRADLLDGIDEVLRRFRRNSQPFGGVQLLMIGDMQQLAPVVKEDEWSIISRYYENEFFFSSLALRKTNFISIELKEIFRQKDGVFIEILNKIRENKLDTESISILNQRYIAGFTPNDNDGYITLTSHNYQAQNINEARLMQIKSKTYTFEADIKGNFPESSYPADKSLVLKTGAQVMFLKNDTNAEKRFFNGKIGKITSIDTENDEIHVLCPGDAFPIITGKMDWENVSYSMDEETKEITENVNGVFSQFPLKLAWAITIHKSQGLTFEKAVIDANASFAHGQVYVALSRCKTLEGMVLKSPINPGSIILNRSVAGFNEDVEKNQPGEKEYLASKYAYQKNLLWELFDFSPIHKQLLYCYKICLENSSVLIGKPAEKLNTLTDETQKILIDTSEKFKNQLSLLVMQCQDIESFPPIQERISKACHYFLEQISGMYNSFKNIVTDTDNKELKKTILTATERAHLLFSISLACLEACKEKFNIHLYLKAKSLSFLNTPEPSLKKTEKENKIPDSVVIDIDDLKYPGLYKELKKWRMEKSTEADLPPFVIMHNTALAGLAEFIPSTLQEMKKIPGIGKKKISSFGEELIELISRYCKANNIKPGFDNNMDTSVLETKKKEKTSPNTNSFKPDTKKISLDLFREGKTLEEIATIRGMATSTIEEHLAHHVGLGDIKAEELVSPEKIASISDFFLKNQEKKLRPAKDALGDDYSWNDLRFVLKKLEYEGKV